MSDEPTRVERRMAQTRRTIVDTAITLIRANGFEATTMEQIAAEADIAKGTLYNYFPSKEAIIGAYVGQSFAERHGDRITRMRDLPDTRARLTLMLGGLMERVQAQADIFELYLAHRVRAVVSLRPDESEGGKSGFGALAAEIVQLGQEAGEIRRDLPLVMLVEFIEFVFVEVAKQFYLEPDGYDAAAAVEQGVNLFLGGAGSDAAGLRRTLRADD